jgi:hypothetical protein
MKLILTALSIAFLAVATGCGGGSKCDAPAHCTPISYDAGAD